MYNVIEEQSEGFTINNDNLAEWAIRKIAEEKAETQRMINVCETFINDYKLKIEQYNKQYESKTAYLKEQLRQYFESVPHKATKTQETYKLPSGTLKRKYGTPEFIRDDEKLLNYLAQHNYTEYVQTKTTPKWAEFKKTIAVQGDKVIDTTTGEIVDGVTIQERPDEFEVEI